MARRSSDKSIVILTKAFGVSIPNAFLTFRECLSSAREVKCQTRYKLYSCRFIRHFQKTHMNTLRRIIFSVAVTTLFFFANHSAPGAEVKNAVDWEKFLAQQDLVWDTLPKTWESGAFIGNGLLGAMIYSGETNALQWDVGRSDVTDKGDRVAIGKFVLVPPTKIAGGSVRIDLWNAEAKGELEISNSAAIGKIQWRSFTHAKDLVNVIEVIDEFGSLDDLLPFTKIEFQHLPPNPARAEAQGQEIPENEKNPDATFGKTDYGVNWCLQKFKAGGGYVVAWAEKDLSPGHHLFFWTVDNLSDHSQLLQTVSIPPYGLATGQIGITLKENFDDLVASHRAWWHDYYQQSFLSIPDARMESFYWIQMYKLGSATRTDRQAIDLMGPWFRKTPWPHIWWNLNMQLTYWPVYAANHLEIGESLTRLLDADKENFINNVPADWRNDSAGVGRSSPYDGKRTVADASHISERGDLTWVLHNYWLQYRFSGDEQMLREKIYPMLKLAVGYYLHLLSPGADGKLHLPPSTSPEYPNPNGQGNSP